MKAWRLVSILLFLLGLACVVAGLAPRLRGGGFATGFFPPGITLILIGGAIRRRRRSDEEREGPRGGK